jgi:class 3 adenylate cyclase/tetratricopeptide (TPR) repeat protein
MDCASCGTANEPDRKFCMECGAALGRVCPGCAAPNPARSKFCGECGTAFDAPDTGVAPGDASSPAAAAPTTERRLVSVLFLDLVGFTTLSEQRDAEDMRTLLDSYFETAQTVIGRHGGVVEKFIGDAVMAVWGTPVAREDDAERAVRAALELVDAVAALGASTATSLQARCGVLTGEAATTVGADHQGMVAGDMVNTASRLQSAADPGTVLVGEATFRAASGSIAFEVAGELELKGKGEPVRAWRALRVVAERQGANRMAVEPPFVGRAEELRMLKELLHATGREGKARVVSVTGIGGIGKSRLAWELLKYVDGLTETIWWHRGRCPSYGDGITFWALGEMLRMRAGIAETDPPGVSRTKLSASVAQHVPDEDERRWLEPRLAFLLGLAERPAGSGEELFAAWRTFFERISDHGTVAMVFEDLQWADAGLLDFIESLLEWSRNRPIFIVTLARPELTDRRPNWGTGSRNFLSLHLEPLPDATMAELVQGMVPDADATSVARIVERAEGMPLYAVEMIRMLADRGVLRAGSDAYELVGDLGELEVPETLHSLIASRLDGLGAADRALLQDAAILGKSFTVQALSVVTGVELTALEPRLQHLTRQEFLVREADPRSPERGQYAFVQSIIREVAYGMLAKADRRSRHLAVAHHLEAADDEELAGAVAAHYVEALQATPPGPDSEALAARARDWLEQATERATSLGSPEQALAFAEQALAITPSGRERAQLLRKAAQAAADALQYDRQLGYLRQAVEVCRGLGHGNDEVVAMGRLAQTLGDRDFVVEMRDVVAAMGQRIGDSDDPLARAEYANSLAFIAYFDGDVDACLSGLDRAIAGFESAHAWDRFQQAMSIRASVLRLLGRDRESEIVSRGLLAVANEANDLRTAVSVLIGLSLQAGEWTEAFEQSLEAAALSRRGGLGAPEMTASANAVEFAVETGEWAKADELLDGLWSRSALPHQVADFLRLDVALLAAYRGDRETAATTLDEVVGMREGESDRTLLAWYGRVRAVCLLTAGDLAGAYDAALAAVDVEPLGPNSGVSCWCAAQAALWLRDAPRARTALERMPPDERSWATAVRRTVEAGIAALEGDVREASSTYEGLLATRLAVGDPFTHALMTVTAMAVLPAELLPDGAVDQAQTYLADLGAHGLLTRFSAVGSAR